MSDILNTRGYIYGNITAKSNFTTKNTKRMLVVVDSEYFLEFYGNRTVVPRSKACPLMFNKIDTIAWDRQCKKDGKEDFLRKVPCDTDKLCSEEDAPDKVVKGYQFTYKIQDTKQPRFWFISLVSCYRGDKGDTLCKWLHDSDEEIELEYDIWMVNGNPYTKHFNPFEHQFSFELHDVVEIYAIFLVAFIIIVPIQLYALRRQRHNLMRLLTACIILEFIGIVLNFIHFFKFAFDGEGSNLMKLAGNFIDMFAECLFMLLLLLIVKGWTITRQTLTTKSKILLFTAWTLYTAANIFLFIWNFTEMDIISDKDEWQTWPGYTILAFRMALMVWFLFELRETFLLENHQPKMRFYLHFGAGFLVWFVYLPIVALIGSQVSALWRFKTILSMTYAADFLSYCVLMHLLWPSRSYLYFNLHTERPPLHMEEFEITERTLPSLLDESMSETEEFSVEQSPRSNDLDLHSNASESSPKQSKKKRSTQNGHMSNHIIRSRSIDEEEAESLL
ncbi:unnamed protein product [Owenia fusiformis]|uniref:GPR180/TMEM145 transmembrane domain-containing protein n=1 Tax=Owenia fusiformis TaxID=6347 RepID=A0A8J1XVJ1_OWEFU|nr:unnamed protein product [Owenia fusiformis]